MLNSVFQIRPTRRRAAAFACKRLVPVLLVWGLVGGVGTASGQPAIPELTGRVVDTADLLSTSTERTVASQLRAQEDATGNQIAVLTIPSLDGAVLEDYSLRVARTWALGQDEFDNGVLLLISRDDREMRIEVGYGLEGDLPDVIASRIIRYEITPRFREGDFDGGVQVGVDAILEAIDGMYEPPSPDFWEVLAANFSNVPMTFRLAFGIPFMAIPSIFVIIGLFLKGPIRWMIFVFLLPFYAVGGMVLAGFRWIGLVAVPIYIAVYLLVPLIPWVRRRREEVEPGGTGISWSSTSGSGFSSSSGGSSSSGFSGGGGSFGGGGASGGW